MLILINYEIILEVIPEESTAMSLAAPAVAIALPDPVIQNTMSVPLLPTPNLSIPQTPSLLGTPLQQPLVCKCYLFNKKKNDIVITIVTESIGYCYATGTVCSKLH